MTASELLTAMKLDLRSLLLQQKEDDLRNLVRSVIDLKLKRSSRAVEARGILVNLLLDEEYISRDELIEALKIGKSSVDLETLLEEPDREKEMERAIFEEFNDPQRYKKATEVPVPGRTGKAPRIDVGILQKAWLGWSRGSVFAFELKQTKTRKEVLDAFAQAKAYAEFCDMCYVALTPMSYWKYHEEIAKQIEDTRKQLGVWIVNKRRKVAVLQEPPLNSIEKLDGKKQIIDFIEARSR